jgi:hypothetical protein
MTRWGIVATIKAPRAAIERFAAWHLDQGAHRVILYLDDGDADLVRTLTRHPQVQVTLCDAAYWQGRGRRPDKHQVRQTVNATHAHNRLASDLDWLAHIDADEFIAPATPPDIPLATTLATLPDDVLCARLRPWEALEPTGPGPLHFKGFTRDARARRDQTLALYPRYGGWLNGGFLSHTAGKLVWRTGLKNLSVRIHNIYQNDVENPGMVELDAVPLLHFHAADRTHFIAAYRYRLTRGSYRADLKPNRPREDGGLSMHDLLSQIEADAGQAGLTEFYTEVATARPDLLAGLQAAGRLLTRDFDPETARARHFPPVTPPH